MKGNYFKHMNGLTEKKNVSWEIKFAESVKSLEFIYFSPSYNNKAINQQ